MNFGELKALLRRSVKNPDEADFPDVECGEYINEGYRDLAARYPAHQTRKRCTFLTVAGQAKYLLPSDLAAVLRLRDETHGNKIWKRGDRAVADQYVPRVQSWPRYYVRYRNYVELLPTPDANDYVIEVYYLAVPAVLTTDVDTPVLPVTWHRGVQMRAKWYYMLDRGDDAQATSALNNYNIWLADKPSEIEDETVDQDAAVEIPELTRSLYSRGGSTRYDPFFDLRD